MPEPLPDQAMLIPLRGRNSNRPTQKTQSTLKEGAIGSLHDPVTWYKITHAGKQVAQWDFQNKGRCNRRIHSWRGCTMIQVILG